MPSLFCCPQSLFKDRQEYKVRILFVGDVVGKAGRRMIAEHLPLLIHKHEPDAVIVNGENAAGGTGVTEAICEKFFEDGADLITLGNHLVARDESPAILDSIENLLRPCNLSPKMPGRGSIILEAGGKKLGVIVVSGRVFMAKIACPFRTVDSEIEEMKDKVDHIIVEVHAEATSEKIALGWHLDGRCSAVIGTHTHVQTADERILPSGTAYITDVGMTGPFDSVLGMKKDVILRRFMTFVPERFETARKDPHLSAVIVDISSNGKAEKISRIFEPPFS